MRIGRRAPRMVGDLNNEQIGRWRDGDRGVWNEDRRGRPLARRAIGRRAAREAREAREMRSARRAR